MSSLVARSTEASHCGGEAELHVNFIDNHSGEVKEEKESISAAKGLGSDSTVRCAHLPARYLLALLGFLGFFVSFSMKASLSVTVVAMVNATSSSSSSSSLQPHRLSEGLEVAADGRGNLSDNGRAYEGVLTKEKQDEIKNHSKPEGGGEVDWDETTQGQVLGAYYYGYTVAQMFGGWLARRLGARNVLGIGMLCSSLVTFLLPWAARTATGLFIAVRIVQGVAESVLFPAMNTMWGVWAPLHERGRLVNFNYASTEIGTVLGMLTSGLLCRYGFAGGWASVFYIHGVAGCVWVLLWMLLVYDSPDKHPRLTHKERALLEDLHVSRKGPKTPWCRFLKSPALWAVAANHFMINWGFSSMATMLPTYMAHIQHFDIQKNGLLSSLPFLAQWLSLMGGSFLMDTLESSGHFATHRSRQLLNGIGGVLGAAFFAGMGHVPEESHVLAVAVMTSAMVCASLCVCCLRVAHLDLSPTHAGTLYGLTNGLGCSAGFLAPAIVGALTKDQQTVSQWRVFFLHHSLHVHCLPLLLLSLLRQGQGVGQRE